MIPNFNKVALYYDDNAIVQRKVGLHMLQILSDKYENMLASDNEIKGDGGVRPLIYTELGGDSSIALKYNLSALLEFQDKPNILDLGCGTGYITNIMKTMHQKSKLTAIDISPNMIKYAKSKYNDIKFIEADFNQLHLNERFDLIYSNMALQWAYNLPNLLRNLSKYLTVQGTLVFSIPLKNTFKNLTKEFVIDLPEHEMVINYIQSNGYKLSCFFMHNEILEFNSVRDAIKHIKSTGASCNINNNISLLKKIYNNPLELNYNIGIYIAKAF